MSSFTGCMFCRKHRFCINARYDDALLETTYKTILEDIGYFFNESDDMNLLYKMVKQILPFNRDKIGSGRTIS